jgi:hypothetical protein
MSGKTDFRRSLDSYASKAGEFRVLEVPSRQYLMIDGSGDPNSSLEFESALNALYPIAYALKFASKNLLSRDYAVPPLEGLWYAEDMAAFTTARDKSKWKWTLLLLTPEWVSPDMMREAVDAVAGKKAPPARLLDARLASLDEGLCVQTLHVGHFDQEGGVLDRMHHEAIPERGLTLSGAHHEIYLSDFRRVPPERQRTILRQPVRVTGS